MIDNCITPFTTLCVHSHRLYGFKRHLKALQQKMQQLQIHYNFDQNLFFSDLNQLESNKTYRVRMIGSEPISWTFTVYLEERFQAKNLSVYPKPYTSAYPQLKVWQDSGRKELLKKAKQQQIDDWLFKDKEGHFLESCFHNLFWIRDHVFYTPSFELPLYQGITLESCIEIAKSLNMRVEYVREKEIKKLGYSNVFICNSLSGVCPITEVNGEACQINLNLVKSWIKRYQDLEWSQSFQIPNLLDSLAR